MRKVTVAKQDKVHAKENGWLAGILTGQIAGLIMAVVVMAVFSLFLSTSPFYPVQVIGSMVFGAEALEGFHLGAVLSGLVLHQAGPSLLWGVVFVLMRKKLFTEDPAQILKLSLILSVLSMAGPYLLIPFFMNLIHGVDYWNQEVPILWDWAAHLVFGLSFNLYGKIAARL